ncbi:MAG TPA: dienelactone hydrolase family protein [Acidimicrobiales bacterium]|nr:dienelactone hydrolase family protein [Acidimicrobiales bacterium]
MKITERYYDRTVEYDGVIGENIEIPTANPVNYYQAITVPTECEQVTIDGKLFLKKDDGSNPLVIVIPGSLGVGPNHEAHAETLVSNGYSVFVLDPFGARAVESTVANQTQYSFAASAFDVLATYKKLREIEGIDPTRIGAQGHSRGGSAILTAITRKFADPIIGDQQGLKAAYAVYPWAGHQFASPNIGKTNLRSIIGELDDWVSVKQVEEQISSILATNANASLRIIPEAHHSFDRREDVYEVPEAKVAPKAPTIMITDDGLMIHPETGQPSKEMTDFDAFVFALKSGFGKTGAHMGGIKNQPEIFSADMIDFFKENL